ncbi:tetratricopeptide repeat protein [Phocoenobacter atlanticus]|uniref:tetratricopeptide repeat protein n=1 Tax=Phocoenobacter atlanticus TaxID=3416742 RepID=UPI00274686CA|nr:tetratricopeptide repeat protein [Pasteurella atlantica]MDP8100599.1 tetratricopeptide repeat protein [Pasteurella atlantica]
MKWLLEPLEQFKSIIDIINWLEQTQNKPIVLLFIIIAIFYIVFPICKWLFKLFIRFVEKVILSTLTNCLKTQKEKKKKPLNKNIGFKGFNSLYPPPTHSITLHSYLYDEQQTYYGWKAYQKENPHNFTGDKTYLNDELLLLKQLCAENAQPLLLIGEGGCGKTRLSLELARNINSLPEYNKKWVAYKSPQKLEKSSLDELITRAKLHKKKIVLVLDYIDTLSGDLDFDELYNQYMEANSEYNQYIRWILTCRSSYFDDEKKPSKLKRENLSVINLSANDSWLNGWRKKACQFIYSDSDNNNDSPILAVIQKYLKYQEIPIEFGTDCFYDIWRILDSSLPQEMQNHYSIAQLTMLFPLNAEIVKTLDPNIQNIITHWQKDGWLHKENNLYALGHDTLCDYSVLYELKKSKNPKVTLNDYWLYSRQHQAEHNYFVALRRTLPIMAMHFSLYALLLEDNMAQLEINNSDFIANNLEKSNLYAMALMSVSLTFKEKWRIFTYTLSSYQIKALKEVFDDEKNKFSTKLKYSSQLYILAITSFPYSAFLRAYYAFLISGNPTSTLHNYLNLEVNLNYNKNELQDIYYLLQKANITNDKKREKKLSHSEILEIDKNVAELILTAYQQLSKMYQSSDILHSTAMYNLAACYGERNPVRDSQQEIDTLEAIKQQYQKNNNEEIQILCAKAMFNLAFCYKERNSTGDSQREIDIYEAIKQQYQISKNEEIQIICTKAMVNLALCYEERNSVDSIQQAIDTYEAIKQQYQISENKEIQRLCAEAMCYLADCYGKRNSTGDSQREIDTYEAIKQQYQINENKEIQILYANAMYNLAVCYTQLNPPNIKQAIATYEEFKHLYQKSKNEQIIYQYTQLVENIAELYLLQKSFDLSIKKAKQAEKLMIQLNNDTYNIAIMYFIRYLANDNNITLYSILEVIKQYPAINGYSWNFKEIIFYIQKANREKSSQAMLFIDYFSGKIDIKQLENFLKTNMQN